jgi:hypothetical protein
VKFVLIAAAAALVLPFPAAAQSLDQTHEPVWHPAGKTPAMVYRQRDRAPCTPTAGHHQSGKAAMPAAKTCPKTVATASTAPSADAAVAR